MDAESWHIPLANDTISIKEALDTMESFKLNQDDVPFIIQLFENPKYKVLPGTVSLQCHDIIHILLGRGLLPKDEAFVIGFTMGSTKGLTSIDTAIFEFVTRYLYPKGYTFGDDEFVVFDMGVKAAENMGCPDLSKLDLTSYIGYTINKAREKLGIDILELIRQYSIEMRSYDSIESQRLL
jgi:hypothetical protein